MKTMATLSLVLNVLVLIPVCFSLMTNAAWIQDAYGMATPARGILLSIYLAIGIVSAILLVNPAPGMILALLAVQIIYKFTTPFTVGTIKNPVVISNIAIAAFHCVTVGLLWSNRLSARL